MVERRIPRGQTPRVGPAFLGPRAQASSKWVYPAMARSMKSYVELQRQHIADELKQREAETRKDAESAWDAEYDKLVLDPSLMKVPTTKH